LGTVKRSKKLFALNVVLLVVPLTYFGYQPFLRTVGRFLIVSEEPRVSDAIVVLAGGEPSRAFKAVELYKAGLAPFVLLTSEPTPSIFEKARRDGIQLIPTYENYMRILEGYGVPRERIHRIEEPTFDTAAEMQRIADFTKQKGWHRLIVVTSNFHTRRSRLVGRYVFARDVEFVVVAAPDDSFKPETWWKTQGQTRTFAIEVEKLLTYTLYYWPKSLWKTRESTKPPNTSSAVWASSSTQYC
jgi:uncharacterized SAM-binding protein YcdF (DUF218 family)